MHSFRKLASIGGACSIPMVSLLGLSVSSPVWATASSQHKSGTVSGIVNCSGSQGSIKFSPPLVPSGTAKPEKSVKVTVSSLGTCTSGASTVSIKKTTASVILGSGSTNLCSNFASGASSDGLKMTISYTTKGVKSTTVTFTAGEITEVTSPSLGFQATGGTATGSYAGSALLTVPLTTTSANAIETCFTGSGGSVPSLQFSGGSATY